MLSHCIVCGKPGDQHHIIHKSEGGLDTPLNYVTLCPEHHRGFMGPHRNSEIDLFYKLEMQKKLEETFPAKYYSAMEIRSLSQLSNSNMKKFMKTNRLHKEGYERTDILFFLMSGNIYRHDCDLQYASAEEILNM